ncbi:MAG: ribonuclease Z [Gammaproteobacteria bacterium]
MRPLFEPRLVNDAIGDPVLYVDLRDERRALLFDLGDVAALAPRHLMRLTHVFVSHAHMDHFAGSDTLLRVVLGRKPRLVLAGGPGFDEQVEHKLRAYTWNVVHRYEVALVLDVHALGLDGRVAGARFSSRSGFVREALPGAACPGGVLLDEPLLRVRAAFVDHGTPCLAFALEEKARVRVDRARLAALGVATGPWLRALKLAVLGGAPPATPIEVVWRDRAGVHTMTRSVGELADVVLDVTPGQRLGFVTDLRDSDANLRALKALLGGVDRLYIECAFLDADRAHAQRKHHLTARQAGAIARAIGARAVTPLHLSPRYARRADEVRAELLAAWRAASSDAAQPPPGTLPSCA